MAIVNIGHHYAEWMPSGSPDKSRRGRTILRSATRLTELFRLTNLGSEDYRNLLPMLETKKPVFWDSEARWLRTAHPQMHDAEPVGRQLGLGCRGILIAPSRSNCAYDTAMHGPPPISH